MFLEWLSRRARPSLYTIRTRGKEFQILSVLRDSRLLIVELGESYWSCHTNGGREFPHNSKSGRFNSMGKSRAITSTQFRLKMHFPVPFSACKLLELNRNFPHMLSCSALFHRLCNCLKRKRDRLQNEDTDIRII